MCEDEAAWRSHVQGGNVQPWTSVVPSLQSSHPPPRWQGQVWGPVLGKSVAWLGCHWPCPVGTAHQASGFTLQITSATAPAFRIRAEERGLCRAPSRACPGVPREEPLARQGPAFLWVTLMQSGPPWLAEGGICSHSATKGLCQRGATESGDQAKAGHSPRGHCVR